MLLALQGLQEQQMINLEDAAVVSWPQGNKKPTTRQLHGGSGALGGAFWGFLFGLIFFVPFLGAAISAAIGAGSMADVGISDDFIKQVREKVTEGTSALFALTHRSVLPASTGAAPSRTARRGPSCGESKIHERPFPF